VGAASFLNGFPPAEDKGNNPDDQEDDKEDLGDLCGGASNTAEPEDGRNDGDDEKSQGPVKHG
jgi:hypothetical protein